MVELDEEHPGEVEEHLGEQEDSEEGEHQEEHLEEGVASATEDPHEELQEVVADTVLEEHQGEASEEVLLDEEATKVSQSDLLEHSIFIAD